MLVLPSRQRLIHPDTRRIDLEHESGSVIVVAVERNGETVRVHEEAVSSAEARGHGCVSSMTAPT